MPILLITSQESPLFGPGELILWVLLGSYGVNSDTLYHRFANHFPEMLLGVELQMNMLPEILDNTHSGVYQALFLVVFDNNLRLFQIIHPVEDRMFELPNQMSQFSLLVVPP